MGEEERGSRKQEATGLPSKKKSAEQAVEAWVWGKVSFGEAVRERERGEELLSCGLGPLGFITGGQATAVQSVAALLSLCFCFHGCLRA